MRTKDLGEPGGFDAWSSFPQLTRKNLRKPLLRLRKRMLDATAKQIAGERKLRKVVLTRKEFNELESFLACLEADYPVLLKKFRKALEYQQRNETQRRRATEILSDKSIPDKERFRAALEVFGLARTEIRRERKDGLKIDYEALAAHVEFVRENRRAGRKSNVHDPNARFKNPEINKIWPVYRDRIHSPDIGLQAAKRLVIKLLAQAYDFPTFSACHKELYRLKVKLPTARDSKTK